MRFGLQFCKTSRRVDPFQNSSQRTTARVPRRLDYDSVVDTGSHGPISRVERVVIFHHSKAGQTNKHPDRSSSSSGVQLAARGPLVAVEIN